MSASVPAFADYGQWVRGEVRGVDLKKGRVRIQHGAIVRLDMPAMTMWYVMSDSDKLAQLSVDDRVMFKVAKLDGHYTVTALDKDGRVAPAR